MSGVMTFAMPVQCVERLYCKSSTACITFWRETKLSGLGLACARSKYFADSRMSTFQRRGNSWFGMRSSVVWTFP